MENTTVSGSVGNVEFMGMLQNAPVNVLYCDREFNIKYVNPKSLETLRTIEKLLPIPAHKVQGSNVDIFHKDPAHQRRILSSDKNLPHRAIIQLGTEKLDLLVSAIYNESREYIGAMVTWDVVTKKIAQDNDLARISSMMENAPINIMASDLDFNLRYMNPASIKTLRSLEHLLPKPVDHLLGQKIDIFH
jgi:methyl-accepting chemotaxis protein